MRYRNVMLVDDDEDDREIFVDALGSVSGEIDCVSIGNPVEALSKLSNRELSPEVIFLDLNMPIMNGQEFLKKIKSQPVIREIPVIIFSTSSNPSTIRQTKELGAIDFITKPNKFDELVKILEQL